MYIYRFKDYLGMISYIGITNNINKRISQHIKNKKTKDIEIVEYYFIWKFSFIAGYQEERLRLDFSIYRRNN